MRVSYFAAPAASLRQYLYDRVGDRARTRYPIRPARRDDSAPARTSLTVAAVTTAVEAADGRFGSDCALQNRGATIGVLQGHLVNSRFTFDDDREPLLRQSTLAVFADAILADRAHVFTLDIAEGMTKDARKLEMKHAAGRLKRQRVLTGDGRDDAALEILRQGIVAARADNAAGSRWIAHSKPRRISPSVR